MYAPLSDPLTDFRQTLSKKSIKINYLTKRGKLIEELFFLDITELSPSVRPFQDAIRFAARKDFS